MNNKHLKLLITLASALCMASARAEDNTTNIITTLVNNGGVNYAVGVTGTNNYLEVNSGGVLTNVLAANIGSNSTAIKNSALVTGTGSAWYSIGAINVGNYGNNNTLTIANGGSVSNGGVNTMIGVQSGATNNTVIITDTNSVWQVSGTDFRVGGSSGYNSLIVSNGGLMRCYTVNDYISANAANGNKAIVTGPGSAWLMTGDLRVGNNGGLNNLTVANGGTVTNTTGTIGGNASFSFNWATVADTNSLWRNSTLIVGSAAKSCSLTVTNGGTVISAPANIGNSITASNNWALVTGSGSAWTNTGALNLGYSSGAYNSLILTNGGKLVNSGALYVGTNGVGNNMTIANGGTAVTTSGIIGNSAVGSNNWVLVTGTSSLWTNSVVITVGNSSASFNSLTVSNGGSVGNGTINLGSAGSTNNTLLVTDSGSFIKLTNYIDMSGVYGSLTLANGGHLTNSTLYIGNNGTARSNTALVTGSGSVLNLGGSGVWLGNGGSAGSLIISNGGLVIAGQSQASYAATASNNTALVTGAGSTFQGSGEFRVGFGGTANSLTIADGGLFKDTTGVIGYTNTAANNTALVTGTGSAWYNSASLYVGSNGFGNSLTIANGGVVTNTSMIIGSKAGADNNSVLVTDSGSFWQNVGDGQVGGVGIGNSLTVSNGGIVSCKLTTGLYIPAAAGSGSNSVLVTGTGSAMWCSGSAIKLGNGGFGGNNLTIADSAVVTNNSSLLVSVSAGCNSNTLTVTGSGSVLNLNGANLNMNSHASTTNNTVNVFNGGALNTIGTLTAGGVNSTINLGDGTATAKVVANNVVLNTASARLYFNAGRLVGAQNGQYIISGAGGQVYVQSGGAEIETPGLDLITGANFQNDLSSPGGGLTKLGTGKLTLLYGGSYTGSTVVSNGTLMLSGSYASSDVAVRSGATLAGSATLNGPVTVEAGANLLTGKGGFDTSKMTVSNSLDLASTAATVISLNRTNANNASTLVVSGALTMGGTLTVTNIGDTLQANDTFDIVATYGSVSGNFSATNLPALSGNQNWWVTNSGATLVVNEWPVAGDTTYYRAGSNSVRIAIANLLTNVTGVSTGQTITLTSVGSGSQGAGITFDATNINYVPANTNNDSFTYTVNDGRGGTATGNINVNVIQMTGQDSATISVTGTNATTYFYGIPGWMYIVQRSTNLSVGAGWVPISTNVIPASGLLTNADNFSDLSVPPYPSEAYYRLQSQ